MPSTQQDPLVSLVDRLRLSLQEAHFAAREIEEIVPPVPEDRTSDRIHILRRSAENLAVQIAAMSRRLPPAGKAA